MQVMRRASSTRNVHVVSAHRPTLGVVLAVTTMSHVEASPGWSPAGSMSTPPIGQTATLPADASFPPTTAVPAWEQRH